MESQLQPVVGEVWLGVKAKELDEEANPPEDGDKATDGDSEWMVADQVFREENGNQPKCQNG